MLFQVTFHEYSNWLSKTKRRLYCYVTFFFYLVNILICLIKSCFCLYLTGRFLIAKSTNSFQPLSDVSLSSLSRGFSSPCHSPPTWELTPSRSRPGSSATAGTIRLLGDFLKPTLCSFYEYCLEKPIHLWLLSILLQLPSFLLHTAGSSELS